MKIVFLHNLVLSERIEMGNVKIVGKRALHLLQREFASARYKSNQTLSGAMEFTRLVLADAV